MAKYNDAEFFVFEMNSQYNLEIKASSNSKIHSFHTFCRQLFTTYSSVVSFLGYDG